MNNKINAETNKVVGNVKEKAGDITGNPGLKEEGIRDQVKGNVQGAVEGVKGAIKNALK